MSDKTAVSGAQYEFKNNCSTGLCCDLFKRTFSYYRNEGSYVFACFVNLRKAFDMVNYWKLFDLLISQVADNNVVRVLCSMYTSQRMYFRWDGVMSEQLLRYNCVRQGSPLSPLLFGVYIDSILQEIAKVDAGCRVR